MDLKTYNTNTHTHTHTKNINSSLHVIYIHLHCTKEIPYTHKCCRLLIHDESIVLDSAVTTKYTQFDLYKHLEEGELKVMGIYF